MRAALALSVWLLAVATSAQTSEWLQRNAAERATRDADRVAAMQGARNALAADLGLAQQQQTDGQRTNERLRTAIAQSDQLVNAARQRLTLQTADLDDLMAAGRQFAGDLHALRQRERIIRASATLDAELSAIAGSDRPLTGAELRRTWQLLASQLDAASGMQELPPPSSGESPLLRVGTFTAYNAEGFYALNAAAPALLATPGTPPPDPGASGFVTVVVDPSRGTAPAMLADRGNLAAHWQRVLGAGGAIGIAIAVLGTLGVVVVLVQLPTLIAARQRIQRTRLGQPASGNPLARLMQTAAQSPDPAALERGLRREVARLERGQPLIGLLVAMAPLLGLLGTVTGLIVTFQTLGLLGGSDPALMAGGISRALSTTALGLAVAVPLALALALLRSLSGACVRLLESFAASRVDAP